MTISEQRDLAPARPRPLGPDPTTEYLLGSSRSEQTRLDLQAAYYQMATANAMHWAGIRPGMHVLDLGSGTGAVAFAAAELVGPTGSVLGLDASPDAVAAANAEAQARGLDHVRFVQADLESWSSPERFDALTGRLICMYLPDPASTIARLAQHLRPGSVVLLEEFSMSSHRQLPETALLQRQMDLVLATFRAVGIPTDLGLDLGHLFRAAGLGTPVMALGGRWEDDPDAIGYALLARVTETLAPAMIKFGLATAAELQVETLETRLRTAAAAQDAAFHPPLLVSAWARTPS